MRLGLGCDVRPPVGAHANFHQASGPYAPPNSVAIRHSGQFPGLSGWGRFVEFLHCRRPHPDLPRSTRTVSLAVATAYDFFQELPEPSGCEYANTKRRIDSRLALQWAAPVCLHPTGAHCARISPQSFCPRKVAPVKGVLLKPSTSVFQRGGGLSTCKADLSTA